MRRKWIFVVAALMLVVAACSSGSNADAVATLDDAISDVTLQSGEEAESDLSEQELLNNFSACMRDNGIEDFEDPIIGADGEVEFNFRPGAGGADEEFGGADRETMQAAFTACGDLLEGLSFGPGGGDFDITEIEDQLVAFAACMREQGIDMDDPDLSNFGPGGGDGGQNGGGGPFGDIDLDDSEVQAALEVCQEDFTFGRGAGGGPGGGG